MWEDNQKDNKSYEKIIHLRMTSLEYTSLQTELLNIMNKVMRYKINQKSNIVDDPLIEVCTIQGRGVDIGISLKEINDLSI